MPNTIEPPPAKEIQEQSIKAPSLDSFLDRDPRTLTADDRRALIQQQRQDRARIIRNSEEKRDKKREKADE